MNAPPFEYVGTGLLALGFVGIGVFILVSLLLYAISKIFKKGK
jgi:TM2 domain-containing membrane protein YozV